MKAHGRGGTKSKADGRQRPLGVAALEDKIVQQAVVTILNAIYERTPGKERGRQA
jgi:retron-type reverse transcriptase